jgi:chemotaxis protein histidine kinase CheA
MADQSTDRYAALRRTYANQLGRTMDAIRQDWARFRRDADLDAAERVRASIHRLTGSGATFGFSDLSEAARETEGLLEWMASDGSLPGKGVHRVEAALTTLMRVAEGIERDPEAAAKPH